MKKNLKGTILSIIMKAIMLGGVMFLFYRYSDHAPLDKSLAKAAVVGILFGIVNTLTENWWLNRAKKHNDK